MSPPLRVAPKPVKAAKAPPPPPPLPKPVKAKDVAPVDSFEGQKTPPRIELTKGVKVSTKGMPRELAHTVEGVQRNYKKLLDAGAKIVVTTSAGNNGRPIVTVVPPSLVGNTDKTKQYDVDVHYHGMHGEVANPAGSSQVIDKIAESFKRSPPTVYVLPTARIVAVKQGDFDTTAPVWKDSVRDSGQTALDGQAGITGTRRRLTVSAHSLGRNALTELQKRGGLKADRVDVQDGFSSNGKQDLEAVYQWMNANPKGEVRISSGMMKQAAIQKLVPFPDRVFDGYFGGGKHWNAELKPWP